MFYRNLFKVWSLVTVHRTEPLIYGSAMDVTHEKSLPALASGLLRSGVTTLRTLLSLAGPDFGNSETAAKRLGMRSIRIVAQIVEKWRASLTKYELQMLRDNFRGSCRPYCKDPFPNLMLSPNLTGCVGIFLHFDNLVLVGSNRANGKALYKLCVKSLNKNSLDRRVDTPWRSVLHIGENARPPLIKKTAWSNCS